MALQLAFAALLASCWVTFLGGSEKNTWVLIDCCPHIKILIAHNGFDHNSRETQLQLELNDTLVL